MNEILEKMLNGVKTLAIVCTQFGDTGKGKFVDYFAEWADIIARGTGGANAGHTIEADGMKMIVHLVPSGILRPGKLNIIGNGVVLDPRQLVRELKELQDNGVDCEERLRIAFNAKLVLPHHIVLDRMSDRAAGNGKIGTTGRGIGPAYVDHYKRVGLIVNDLLNPDLFMEKLRRSIEDARRQLQGFGDPEAINAIMGHVDLANGAFYSKRHMFDIRAIADAYFQCAGEIEAMITDTDDLIRNAVGKKNILAEGAQGLLLSIDYGTYPFVTSSDCSDQGLARSIGLQHRQIDKTLAIAKAFFMTRVGEGPFPTEMGGEQSDTWCGRMAAEVAKKSSCESVREFEAKEFASVTLAESDEFNLGIAVRIKGDEYGATTGRPRRTGWLDLPLLKHSVRVTGNRDLILTKLDVLDLCPTIKVCTSYEYRGSNQRIGERLLKEGDILPAAIPHASILEQCRPVYREFPGWMCDIRGAKSENDLPSNLVDLINFVETETGTRAQVLSVGPDRNQTIFR